MDCRAPANPLCNGANRSIPFVRSLPHGSLDAAARQGGRGTVRVPDTGKVPIRSLSRLGFSAFPRRGSLSSPKQVCRMAPEMAKGPTTIQMKVQRLPSRAERAGSLQKDGQVIRRHDAGDRPGPLEDEPRLELGNHLRSRIAPDDHLKSVDREYGLPLEPAECSPGHEKRREEEDLGEAQSIVNRAQERRAGHQDAPHLFWNGFEGWLVAQGEAGVGSVERVCAKPREQRVDPGGRAGNGRDQFGKTLLLSLPPQDA